MYPCNLPDATLREKTMKKNYRERTRLLLLTRCSLYRRVEFNFFYVIFYIKIVFVVATGKIQVRNLWENK